jgi:hypothetical protein
MKEINIIFGIICMHLAGFLFGAWFLNHIDGLTFCFTFATALFCGFGSFRRA